MSKDGSRPVRESPAATSGLRHSVFALGRTQVFGPEAFGSWAPKARTRSTFARQLPQSGSAGTSGPLAQCWNAAKSPSSMWPSAFTSKQKQ